MKNYPGMIRFLPLLLLTTFGFNTFAEEIEEVVVTGSYIKGTPEDAACR